MEKEAATTQPRPAPLHPSKLVCPYSILLKDGVIACVNLSMSGEFWTLNSN
jgi:hypothetical protein